MTPEDIVYWSQWRPENDGSGKRRWFVSRRAAGGWSEVAVDSLGRYRRFASYEAAKKVSDALQGVDAHA